jgi:serine/threonine protein kinase
MEKIGRYQIVGQLGRGAFGVVYKGRDPVIGRLAAIKVMSESTVGDKELVNRFKREAMAAGGLQHRNILTIYDLGDHNGFPYIAMEYVEGTDLDKYIKEKIEISMEKKIDLIIQIAEALGYAHKKGIVHRDIKPGNIRVQQDGQVKIMDFGIAKIEAADMTRTGQFMGTVNYMSPEQVKVKKVDGRSDLFALGIIFYELVSYRKPFPGESISAVIYRIVNELPVPLQELRGSPYEYLEPIILKCLEKDPQNRFQTCEALAEALKQKLRIATTPDARAAELEATVNTSLKAAASGNFQAAISLLDKVIQEKPDHEAAKQHRSFFLLEMLIKESHSLVSAGRLEQARDRLKEATAIPRTSQKITERHAYAASALARLEEKLKQAKVEELLARAQTYHQEQRFEQAIGVLDELIRLDRYHKEAGELLLRVKEEQRNAEIGSLVKLGEGMEREGRLEDARNAFDQALAIDPYRRDLKSRSDEIERKLEAGRRKKEIDDLLYEATALLNKESFDQAIPVCEKILAIEPAHGGAQRLLSTVKQARIKAEQRNAVVRYVAEGKKLLEGRNFTAARAKLMRAKELQPDNAEVRSLLEAADKKVPFGRAAEARKVSPAFLYGAVAFAVVVVALGVVFLLMRKTPAEVAFLEAEKAGQAGKLEDSLAKLERAWDLRTDNDKEVAEQVPQKLAALGASFEGSGNYRKAGEVFLLLNRWGVGGNTMDRFKALAGKLGGAGDLEGESWIFTRYFEDRGHEEDYDFISSYQAFADQVMAAAAQENELDKKATLYDISYKAYRKLEDLDPASKAYESAAEARTKKAELAGLKKRVAGESAKLRELFEEGKNAQDQGNFVFAKEKFIAVRDGLQASQDIAKYLKEVPDPAQLDARIGDCENQIAEADKSRTIDEKISNYLASAKQFETDGNLLKAQQYYDEILKLKPGDAEVESGRDEVTQKIEQIAALRSEAETFRQSGQFDKAREAVEKIRTVNPNEPEIAAYLETIDREMQSSRTRQEVEAKLAAADAAMQSGNYDTARKIFDEVDGMEAAGREDRLRARTGKAEANRRLNQDKIAEILARAEGALGAKDYVAAKKLYNDVLRNYDSQNKQALGRIAEIDAAESGGQRKSEIEGTIAGGRYAEALGMIRRDPSLAAYRNRAVSGWAGQIRGLMASNLDEAARQAGGLEAYEPQNAVIREVGEATKKRDESRRLLQEARALVERKTVDSYRQAKEKLNEALGVYPKNSDAQALLTTVDSLIAGYRPPTPTPAPTPRIDADGAALAEIRSLCEQGSYGEAANRLSGVLGRNPGSAEGRKLVGCAFFNASLNAFLRGDCGSAKEYANQGSAFGDPDCERMQEHIDKSNNCTAMMVKAGVKAKERFKSCP